MRSRDIAVFGCIAFALSGCNASESSLNPFNWFGTDEAGVPAAGSLEGLAPQDIRPLIPVVSSVTLEPTPGGVILRATGLPPEQGWYKADLVSENRGEPVDGVLTLDFRAIPPREQTRQSTVQSREIVVGRYITEQQLVDIREIQVVGETNTRSIRP